MFIGRAWRQATGLSRQPLPRLPATPLAGDSLADARLPAAPPSRCVGRQGSLLAEPPPMRMLVIPLVALGCTSSADRAGPDGGGGDPPPPTDAAADGDASGGGAPLD